MQNTFETVAEKYPIMLLEFC